MDSIVFFYDKGKVIKGKVTYYEDWYEKWKAGLSNVEMMSIEFDEDEAPTGLTKEDFQGVYDQADEEFKNKMGVSYEEFCQAGEPSYKEIITTAANGLQAQNEVIDAMVENILREKL